MFRGFKVRDGGDNSSYPLVLEIFAFFDSPISSCAMEAGVKFK